MATIDAVEAARLESALVDQALEGDERRAAIRDTLREVYADQGQQISDETLDLAIDKMERERYRHVDTMSPRTRLLANLYIRRNAIVGSVVAATVVIGGGTWGYAAWQDAAAQREAAAIEDQTQRLLTRIDLASSEVDLTPGQADDVRIDPLVNVARGLVEDGRLAEAGAVVDDMDAILEETRSAAKTSAMRAEADTLVASLAGVARTTDARAAIRRQSENLKAAAAAGDTDLFQRTARELRALADRIRTPLTVQIVDRGNEKSGVRRTSDKGETVSYLIVEAIGPDGRPVPQEVTDFESGRKSEVPIFGVQVPDAVYQAVGQDKKADGVVNDKVAGRKPAGAIAISWDKGVNGNMITRW